VASRAADRFTDSRPASRTTERPGIVATTDALKLSSSSTRVYRTIESMKLTRMAPRDGRDA